MSEELVRRGTKTNLSKISLESEDVARRGLSSENKNNGSGAAYLAANLGLGTAGILEGTIDVVAGGLNQLFGGERGERYAKYLHANDVTGTLTQNLNKSYNPDGFMKFMGEANQGIGQSAIFALNMVAPGAGSALFFIGAGGRSVSEAYNTTGELGAKEYAYGGASALTELALERVSGGILKGAGMGGKTLQNTIFKGLSKVGKDAATTAVRNGFVKQVLSEASSEFIEEFLGSYTDVLWQRAFQVDPNASVTFGDAIYSGLVGAASGGLMSGVGNGVRATYSNYRGNQVIKEGKADNLVRTVDTIQQYVKSNDWSKYANNGQITGVMNDLIAAYQAYNKLSETDRTGARAAVYLGEMQMNLAFLESAVGVAKISDKVKADAEAYVDFANRTWGKEYTAEDIRNNKDDVLHQLSVMRWAGQFAESETVGSRKMNWVREQLKRNQDAAGTTETDTDTTANAQTTNTAPQPTKTGKTADGIEYTENDLDGVTARVYNLGEGKNVVAVQNDNGTWSIEAGDSENLASDLGELIGTTVKDKNLDGEIKNIRDNYDALVDKARKTAEARKAQEADNNTETDNKAQKGSDKATKGKSKEESKSERDTKAGKVVEGTKNTRYATADDLKLAGIETSKVIKSKLDMKQKATAILFDKWFAKSGLQLMLFEGNGSGRNGSYMANTIYVDINSSMFQVAAHELVHSFKARSAEMYKSIESFIVDKAFKGDSKLLDEAIKRYQELYNKNGIVLDYEGAKEELIAKSCEKVFGSIQGLKDILAYNKKLFNAANKFFASMESFFQDIIDESGESNQYAEAMAASLEDITELRKRFAQAMAEITKSNSKKETNRSGASFSLKENGNISQRTIKYYEDHKGELGHISQEMFDTANNIVNKMAARMLPYLDITNNNGKRYLPEEILGKTMFNNGSYDKSVENTTICFRTLAYIDFTNEVKKEIGRPLTVEESFLASQMLYDIAKEPQCLYCYVSLDRKAYDGFLLEYVKQRDAVLNKFASLKNKNKTEIESLYQDFLNKRKDTKQMRQRFNLWINTASSGEGIITYSDLITEEKRSEIKNKGGLLEKQMNDAERYAQSASWSKKLEQYRAYNGDILNMSPATVKKLNSHYGLRFYSFSEYTPAFIVENMQQIRDAAVKGLYGLAYTKKTDFARIFANTGMNINISCFGKMVDGKVQMDTRQGADWKEVQELRKQYKNVGAVFVSTSDALTEWALAQDWIDVVIPFHIVRTGANIAEFYKWTNNTKFQADKTAEGKNKTITPAEHHNDLVTFKKLIAERNLTPRFEQFIENPNYMKLVNETRLSDLDSSKLVPVFDYDAAIKSFEQFVNDGGYYGDWYNEDIDYKAAIKTVASDIRAGVKANEVSYGRQDINVSEEMSKRKTIREHGSKASISEDSKAPVFYSQMSKVIDDIKQDKIGAAGVVSYLKGRGVKDEEIKWSGIEEFLEGKKSVTKSELQEFAAGSMLQIVEDIRKTNDYLALENKLLKYQINFEDWFDEIGIDGVYDPNLGSLKNQLDMAVEFEMMSQKKADKLYKEAEKVVPKLTKYNEYSFSGGDNYREMLFKLPNSTFQNVAMKGHWKEKGILAHVRMQDMLDEDGRKMLFIEEIQSDWHNEGNLKGYLTKDETKKITEIQDKLRDERKALKDIEDKIFDFLQINGIPVVEAYQYATDAPDIDVASNRLVGIAKQDFVRISKHFEKRVLNSDSYNKFLDMVEQRSKKIDEIDNLYDKVKNKSYVPDAPFKNTYTDFVIKRLLRMAADENYDLIGWTTAEDQDYRWKDNGYHEEGKGRSGNLQGYKIEYDQDIPKFLNKYGKKWGAKVEKTYLKNNLFVWSFPITDSMKQSVQTEGQPLYSVSDQEYLDLAKEPEKNQTKLQQLVEQAARKAGFNSPMLYHGTKSFGFTKIRTSGIEYYDWSPFFTTDDINVAYSYTKNNSKREIGKNEKAKKIKLSNDIKNYIAALADDFKKNKLLTKLSDSNMVDYLIKDSAYQHYYEIQKSEKTEDFKETAINYIKGDVIWRIADYTDSENGDRTKWFNQFENNPDIYENLNKLAESMYEYAKLKEPFGTYSFYANTDNMLIVEGNGKNWNRVPVDGVIENRKYANTRQIAKYAKDNGYSGVIIKDITDSGAFSAGGQSPSNVYVFFNPESQVKSADAVTYDDNNNVIPLSERFNDTNDDIRYSLSEDKDYGYHAGDLGKSTVDDYLHQSYSRGTGHFGFGTYFVGDESQINTGNYAKRPHEKVDFSKYNLFKPANESKAYDLHRALKVVDGFIKEYSAENALTSVNDMLKLWGKRYSEKRQIEKIIEDWDDNNKQPLTDLIEALPPRYRDKIYELADERYKNLQDTIVNDEFAKSIAEIDYDYGIRYIDETKEEYINRRIESIKENYMEAKQLSIEDWRLRFASDVVKEYLEDVEFKNKALDNLAGDLQRAFDYDFREKEIADALIRTKVIVDGYNDVEGLDSAATVFMKQLGYEGVDVRHLKGLDNTGYGSVIYDLKGEDLARKKEIGTAKYSFSENRGNGYDGYSMSNNARAAYAAGEKPWSKWSKSDLLEAVSEINPNKLEIAKKLKVEDLRKAVLSQSSWHHTSKYYNKTNFFTPTEYNINRLGYHYDGDVYMKDSNGSMAVHFSDENAHYDEESFRWVYDGDPIPYEEKDNKYDAAKYSVSEDSEGNKLSPEQQEYFQNSQATDENGKLMVVYHGSPESFTVFGENRSEHFGKYKFGDNNVNFFTTAMSSAEGYARKKDYTPGQLLKGYVNIVNPFVVNDESSRNGLSFANGIKDSTLRKFEIDLWEYRKEQIKEADTIEEANEYLKPFRAEIRYDGEYYELYRLGDNFAFTIEEYIASERDIWSLFEDNEQEITDEIIGEKDDYYFTTNDIVKLVIAMNEWEGTDYDGIRIDNIYDSTGWFGEPGTDFITIKDSNQFKNIDNINPTSNPDIRYSISDSLSDTAFPAAEQDEARKLVDNFDIYSYDTKRSIIEFMRSAAGTKADKATIKTIANIIASTEDLDVRFAESNQNGELSTSKEGYRLIILNKNLESAQQIRQTLAAEIIHLSEDTRTYGKFANKVLAATTPEEQEEVKNKYKAYYESIGEQVDDDTLLKECVSELGAELIQRYDIVKKWSEADKKLALRLVYSARNLARSLFGKDKEAYKAAAKLSGTITAAFGESVLRKAVGAPAVKWSLADDNVALKEKTERQQRVINALKDYIKLQQTVTNGKTVSRDDVKKVAAKLMSSNHAKGDINEIIEILQPMYQAMYDNDASSIEMRAFEAANWIYNKYVPAEKYNEEAKEILSMLQGTKIYISDHVKSEIVNRFESMKNFQNAVMGTIILSNSREALDLETAWREWSARYGSTFDADYNYADMPERLVEIIQSLRNTESYDTIQHNALEKGIKDQIFDEIVQASADIGFTETLADKYEKKLAEQKLRLKGEIDALKTKNKEKLEKLKQQNKQLTKELQNQARSIHYFTRSGAKARINEIVSTYIAKYFGEGNENLARDFAAADVETANATFKVTGIDNVADRLYNALYEDMTPGQMKKAAKEFAAEIIARTKMVVNGKETPVTEALDSKNVSLSIIAENEIKERIYDMLNGGEIRGEEEKIKIRYENMFKRAQEEFNKRMNNMQTEINNAKGTQKAILQSIEQIARTRKQYKDGNYQYNGILATDQVKVLSDFILKAKKRGGFLDAAGVRNAMLAYKAIFTNGDITNALNEEYTVLGLNYESLTELNQAVYEVLGDLDANDEHEMTKKLTAREIETFSDVAKAVAQLYRTYNKYYDEKRKEWVDADNVAKKAIDNVQHTMNLQATDKKLVKTFKQLFAQYGIETLDPLAVAKLFDGYADDGVMTELMSDIINAENAKTYRIQQYMKDVDEFIKKTKGFEKHLTSEEDMIEYRGVKLTRDEFIQLYMTTFRKQALLHLGMGRMEFGTPGSKYGLRILEPAIKTLGGADAMKKIDDATIEDFMTESEKIARDIQQLGDKVLTTEDKQYIALMEKFYNVTSTQDKSAADYKYFGMTNVIEDPLDRYVPIVTSRSSRASSVTDERSAMQDFSTLSGQSFNKNTIRGAKNPLSFTGAYGLMAKHANGLAAYVELYSSFQKLDRIWSTDINHDKQNTSRLRDAINNAYGKQAEDYIRNLMGDVQGINRKQPNAFNPLIARLRSNYAIFQLGANPKTWFNQLGSMGALVRFCDLDSITKGIAAPNKADMTKYSTAAAIREGSDVVVKAQTLTVETKNKVTEIAMKPIGIADMKIVQMSWGACQYQVEKTQGFAVGTEANKKAAGELLNKVINESQDTSLASTKTGIARSENDLIKGLAMFRSAPFKQYSRLVEAVGTLSTLNAKKKAGESVSETRIKEAKTELCRTAAGWTMQAVIGIAITAGFNWLYAKDDDDETMKDKVFAFIGELLSVVPILGDIYSFFVDGFDMSYFAYDMVNDAADATKKTVSLVGDTINGKKVSRQDVAKQIYNDAQVLGQFTGIPVRNVKNFLTGIVKRVSKTFGGSVGYELDAGMYTQSYNKDLAEALAAGNIKLANTVINLLYQDKKATSELSDNVASEILKLYGEGYTSVLPATIGDSITVDGQEYTIGASEQKQIRTIANGADKKIAAMIKTDAYKSLSDESKAKAIKNVYTVYYDKAVNEVFGIPVSKKLALSMLGDVTEISAAAAHIAAIKSETDENGKTVSGSRKNQVSDYINSLNIDEDTAYLILYAAGYSSDSLKQKVSDIAAQSKLTNDEYAEVIEALNLAQ